MKEYTILRDDFYHFLYQTGNEVSCMEHLTSV